MKQENKDLISCLRAAFLGEKVDCKVADCVSLAQQHGVLHLLYYAVAQSKPENKPDEELCAALKRKAYGALIREATQQRMLEELYSRFEASQIRCTALKGIVLKNLYPKPEFRFMSDIDILIDPRDAEAVRQHFEEMGCYVLTFDQSDTDLYLSPEGLNFEVKRTLRFESFNKTSELFLDKLLSFAVPIPGYSYVSALPNEEHYAYIICHMVKHMLDGGVGVRPVMDLWVCKNHMKLDENKKNELLRELKLTKFAEEAEHLADVWFGNEEERPFDAELGEYILSSGSFGSAENRVVDRIIHSKKGKGRIAYVLGRLFLPYRSMCYYFPVLQKWPVLLPVFWFWRMIRAAFCRRGKLSEELSAVSEANGERLSQRLSFYQRCGIDFTEK